MKKNILLVGNFLGTGLIATPGPGDELAAHLAARGNHVITVSHKHARVTRLFDMLSTIWQRRTEYDVAQVDVFSGAAFLWAELVALLLGMIRKPYILTLHGGNLPVFARRWTWRVRRLLQRAPIVTAPSRYLQAEMHPYRQDITLLSNPIEVGNYPYRLRSEARPRLIWLRAFHAIYNPQMAPRVINSLCATFPEITLVMVGPDKGDGTLQDTKALIEELGLQKQIEIVPGIPKSKVPQYMKGADILINTTTIDNTPISVLEAMACGLCVVSTNVGGIPYLLEDGYDALLVSPNNFDAMANAIQRILTEPNLAPCLSQNARRKTEQFDWSVVLPQWETLFQEVLRV